MRSAIVLVLTVLGLSSFAPRASAQPIAMEEIPETLRPWVPWALHDELTYGCSLGPNGAARCDWPSSLRLEVDDTEARFVLDVTVDRRFDVPIPGSSERWPIEVEVDGTRAAVLGTDAPHVRLSPGAHHVTGRFRWTVVPETLPIPAEIARVDLVRAGVSVPRPQRGASGEVWLESAEREASEEDVVTLEVHRRIADGMPLDIETAITVRASGRSRELALGDVLLAGSIPVELDAELPVRFTEGGELTVQVRAGTYELRIRAYRPDPEGALTPPTLPSPWPEQEIWVWQANESFRQVEPQGAPAIDPQRTSIPDEWRSLPVYLVAHDAHLTLDTLRRGEAMPPPNQVTLTRELWLDVDGIGYTVRDTLGGAMHRSHRLELAEGALGRVSTGGRDQLITTGDVGSGVEIRSEHLDMTAEWRLEDATSSLPGVGWSEDAQSASATLHLPPGYLLVHAGGVDAAPGTWLDEWTLLSLFALLLLSVAFAQAFGRAWGPLVFVALGLAFHECDVPLWPFFLLSIALLLHRALVVRPLAERLARWSYWLVLLTLLVSGATFVVAQVRVGLYPQLDAAGSPYGSEPQLEEAPAWLDDAEGGMGRRSSESWAPSSDAPSDARMPSSFDYGSNAIYLDPNAVVQTGPGLPSWSWRSYSLSWSGPVARDQRIALYLLAPWASRAIAILRAALFLALIGLVVWRRPRGPVVPPVEGLPSAALAAALALLALVPALAPASAQAQPGVPSPELLGDLRDRLVAPPACAPSCTSTSDMTIRIAGDRLVVDAEVHSGALAAHPLPGPSDAWVPDVVTVDGASAPLARLDGGFLYVRLSEGAHALHFEGSIGGRDALTLALGLAPRNLRVEAPGWDVDGMGAEGRATESVQLRRQIEETSGGAIEATNLPTWLEVERTLTIGVRWTIETVVRRRSPGLAPAVARIQLLANESVTTSSVATLGREVIVNLGPSDTEVHYSSVLALEDEVTFTAASSDARRSEVWILACGPLWHCTHDGIAPTEHLREGVWAPRFDPWPGETVTFGFSRPSAAEGQSTTVDGATYTVTPGARLSTSRLTLSVRSSTSSSLTVTLPSGADVQTLTVNGATRPLSREGDVVTIALQPGATNITMELQLAEGWTTVTTTPSITLGSVAVNAELTVELSPDRWVLWLSGPPWGPAVLFWGFLALILVVAGVLSQQRDLPLRTHDWVLLGLGLTQIPVEAALIIVGWFFVFRLRGKPEPRGPIAHDAFQLGLALYTVIAFFLLAWAVREGLLGEPDMQITGPRCSSASITYYVDRTTGALPVASIVSVPEWVYRALMFAWAIWLVVRLVAWVRWAWAQMKQGGLWLPMSEPKPVAAPVVGETKGEGESKNEGEGKTESESKTEGET
jgi:hypothetical protein